MNSPYSQFLNSFYRLMYQGTQKFTLSCTFMRPLGSTIPDPHFKSQKDFFSHPYFAADMTTSRLSEIETECPNSAPIDRSTSSLPERLMLRVLFIQVALTITYEPLMGEKSRLPSK